MIPFQPKGQVYPGTQNEVSQNSCQYTVANLSNSVLGETSLPERSHFGLPHIQFPSKAIKTHNLTTTLLYHASRRKLDGPGSVWDIIRHSFQKFRVGKQKRGITVRFQSLKDLNKRSPDKRSTKQSNTIKDQYE